MSHDVCFKFIYNKFCIFDSDDHQYFKLVAQQGTNVVVTFCKQYKAENVKCRHVYYIHTIQIHGFVLTFLTGFVGLQIRGTSSVYQQKEYKGVIKVILLPMYMKIV